MRASRLLVITALVGTLGCGDDASGSDAGADAAPRVDATSLDAGTDAASGADAGRDATTDAAATDGSTTDGSTTDGSTTDGSTTDGSATDGSTTDGSVAGCADAIESLRRELYASIGTCSVVLRLDHDTRRTLGYQVFCGRYAAVTEPAARLEAQSVTGHGGAGTMLNAPMPEDLYVFYEPPGDFGGAAAVNARNGRAVFGGSIVWSGRGDITYPATWRDPAELGRGCGDPSRPPPARGYDLVDGTALDAGEVDAALAVALDTAIAPAFVAGGYVFDAVVLRYPRSVGAFDPSSAEWIVVVNGGWLD